MGTEIEQTEAPVMVSWVISFVSSSLGLLSWRFPLVISLTTLYLMRVGGDTTWEAEAEDTLGEEEEREGASLHQEEDTRLGVVHFSEQMAAGTF